MRKQQTDVRSYGIDALINDKALSFQFSDEFHRELVHPSIKEMILNGQTLDAHERLSVGFQKKRVLAALTIDFNEIASAYVVIGQYSRESTRRSATQPDVLTVVYAHVLFHHRHSARVRFITDEFLNRCIMHDGKIADAAADIDDDPVFSNRPLLFIHPIETHFFDGQDVMERSDAKRQAVSQRERGAMEHHSRNYPPVLYRRD